MKRVEHYIPQAINVIEDCILREQNRVVPEWDNCVANFGAAIRQMGLLTAVTAFSPAEPGRSKVSKKDLMHYLLRMILLADGKVCEDEQDLLDLVKQKPHDKLLHAQVTDAAVAMKLALRLFIDEPKEEEDASDD
jgi:hypothetical protein